MVNQLIESLDHEHTIHWDQGMDRWETGARAWHAARSEHEWHVVIQDDAILCDDFAERATEYLSRQEFQPVSFYLGSGRPRQNSVKRFIKEATGDTIIMPWMIWGVCVAIPYKQAQAMLHGCKDGIPNYDTRISQYFERRRIQTAYSWPSLVDHRDEPSLIHHGLRTKRVAHNFAGSSQHWGKVPA